MVGFWSYWVLQCKWIYLGNGDGMPYFRWTGVDIVGATKRGKQAAYCRQELSDQLFVRGIALLQCTSVYTPSFLWPISAQAKSDVFRHIATLLKAGILLPEVLEIAAQQSNNPFLYDWLFSISSDIKSGVPFAVALDKHKNSVDPIVKIMLVAGHDSGRLIHASENASSYYKTHHFFTKNIRSVLAMPLLTLLFFIGISSFIFIFIIPRFAQMFSSLDHTLPVITQYMICISDFIRSWSMVILVGIVAVIVACLWHYFRHDGKKVGSILLMNMPFVGTFICQHQYGQVLYALSLLIASGIPVVPALEGLINCIDNVVIKKRFNDLLDQLLAGRMLSDAMVTSSFFLPEACALARIGEKSGTLAQSLESAAHTYSDTMQQSMQRFVFFLQPIVIMFLGLLITALIFAVYLPIMQLSHAL